MVRNCHKGSVSFKTGASKILARRHYISVSLLDFYRQVKLNLFHHYLLKILSLSFCCCLAFVCMHWSLTFSNNTLEKDDIRVTKLAHNGSFADKVLAVLTKSTSLCKNRQGNNLNFKMARKNSKLYLVVICLFVFPSFS